MHYKRTVQKRINILATQTLEMKMPDTTEFHLGSDGRDASQKYNQTTTKKYKGTKNPKHIHMLVKQLYVEIYQRS